MDEVETDKSGLFHNNRQFLAIVRDDDNVLLFKKTDVNYTRLLQKRTHKVVLLCSTDVLFSAVNCF